jgi:hypothetical protein
VGTVVTLNGEVKGKSIPGYDVYRALLRVWLGDQPTSRPAPALLAGAPFRAVRALNGVAEGA